MDKKKEEKLKQYDISKTRTILISSVIDSKLADRVIKELLFLEYESKKKPIKMIINSPGGEVTSGMAICDLMQMISCPVYTIATGIAASMGSLLLVGGAEGKCFATRSCRIMIHQPLIQSAFGRVSDLVITAEEIEKTKNSIAEMYQKKTKKTRKKILEDMDIDKWFDTNEALRYGLIDNIIDTLDIK